MRQQSCGACGDGMPRSPTTLLLKPPASTVLFDPSVLASTISELLPATGIALRETGPDYEFGWHNAPRRQFVIMLSGGAVEIEVGDGSRRRLHAGDILLAEDTTGRGHISRAVDDQPRVSLFVTLD